MVIAKIIRVAQVIGMATDGGVESCIMNYYKNVDHNRVQFDFFVESTSKIINKEIIESMGGRLIIIPHYTHVFKYIKFLKKAFKEGNYDIVHSNMNALSVFTLYAAKKAGIKVRIAHSHSTSNKKEWKKNIVKNILRPFSKTYSTHYFACSELAGRWLFGNKTYEQGKVTIINNAIDLERFKFNEDIRNSMRKQLEINDKFCLGHIGRFMTQKNQLFLIDIFNEFQKIRSNSVLLILGDGPLRGELEQRVKDYNLKDKVIFAGVQERPEQYYQAMDCFLLPSLYEGLPVVGVEAQINGLNCYFSTGITKEAKILQSTCYLDLNIGAEAWAQEIEKNCVAELDYSEIAVSGVDYSSRPNAYKHFVGSNYDIQSEANKLLGYYAEMLG